MFDLRRRTAKTNTMERLILEALFADSSALMAHRESRLKLVFNRFAEASRLFGLTISICKDEVLHQSAPGTAAPSPKTSIDGIQVKVVENLMYFGSTTSCDGYLDKEIYIRICRASQALGCLHTGMLNTIAYGCLQNCWFTEL